MNRNKMSSTDDLRLPFTLYHGLSADPIDLTVVRKKWISYREGRYGRDKEDAIIYDPDETSSQNHDVINSNTIVENSNNNMFEQNDAIYPNESRFLPFLEMGGPMMFLNVIPYPESPTIFYDLARLLISPALGVPMLCLEFLIKNRNSDVNYTSSDDVSTKEQTRDHDQGVHGVDDQGVHGVDDQGVHDVEDRGAYGNDSTNKGYELEGTSDHLSEKEDDLSNNSDSSELNHLSYFPLWTSIFDERLRGKEIHVIVNTSIFEETLANLIEKDAEKKRQMREWEEEEDPQFSLVLSESGSSPKNNKSRDKHSYNPDSPCTNRISSRKQTASSSMRNIGSNYKRFFEIHAPSPLKWKRNFESMPVLDMHILLGFVISEEELDDNNANPNIATSPSVIKVSDGTRAGFTSPSDHPGSSLQAVSKKVHSKVAHNFIGAPTIGDQVTINLSSANQGSATNAIAAEDALDYPLNEGRFEISKPTALNAGVEAVLDQQVGATSKNSADPFRLESGAMSTSHSVSDVQSASGVQPESQVVSVDCGESQAVSIDRVSELDQLSTGRSIGWQNSSNYHKLPKLEKTPELPHRAASYSDQLCQAILNVENAKAVITEYEKASGTVAEESIEGVKRRDSESLKNETTVKEAHHQGSVQQLTTRTNSHEDSGNHSEEQRTLRTALHDATSWPTKELRNSHATESSSDQDDANGLANFRQALYQSQYEDACEKLRQAEGELLRILRASEPLIDATCDIYDECVSFVTKYIPIILRREQQRYIRMKRQREQQKEERENVRNNLGGVGNDGDVGNTDRNLDNDSSFVRCFTLTDLVQWECLSTRWLGVEACFRAADQYYERNRNGSDRNSNCWKGSSNSDGCIQTVPNGGNFSKMNEASDNLRNRLEHVITNLRTMGCLMRKEMNESEIMHIVDPNNSNMNITVTVTNRDDTIISSGVDDSGNNGGMDIIGSIFGMKQCSDSSSIRDTPYATTTDIMEGFDDLLTINLDGRDEFFAQTLLHSASASFETTKTIIKWKDRWRKRNLSINDRSNDKHRNDKHRNDEHHNDKHRNDKHRNDEHHNDDLINLTDNLGRTPLHHAVHYYSVKEVQLFLEQKEINPLIKTSRGETPLDLAYRLRKHSESPKKHIKILKIIQMLEEYTKKEKFSSSSRNDFLKKDPSRSSSSSSRKDTTKSSEESKESQLWIDGYNNILLECQQFVEDSQGKRSNSWLEDPPLLEIEPRSTIDD